MRRLEKRRLVQSRSVRNGKRAGREFTLTLSGKAALRAWLKSPITPDVVSTPIDPIRTRLFFLGSLAPADRTRFVGECERKLRDEVERAHGYDERELPRADAFGRLASRGARLVLQARLEWIRGLRRTLKSRARRRRR